MTPKVGRTWKSSAPSLVKGVSEGAYRDAEKGSNSSVAFLQDVFEVCSLGADAEVIQHHAALRVLELGSLGLRLHGGSDGV